MKYPIGIQTFEQLINGGFVYVDKTELVYRLVNNGKVYFLGRPRRFAATENCRLALFHGKRCAGEAQRYRLVYLAIQLGGGQ